KTMMTADILKAKRHDILQLAAQHGAHHVRVSGSVARGESGTTSDIDLLVKMDQGCSLLDLIELSQELESVLQCKVDILTDEGLSPYLKERIHAEAVPL
ncbi:MAG TPA: nucleotidyltransferase family protein, partial [Nitrospira sp.]|nr:nucleotidyltransferase family protein [Nitrospira sp.]